MPAGAGPNDPNASASADPAAAGSFAVVMDRARQDLDAGRLAEGLLQLSAWYDNPQLGDAEQQQLCSLLDQIAGTVIYSTKDLLEPPYEVQPGDRLEDIGQRYNVPWQLLGKINGIGDPQSLRPGDRLKIVRGPFEAIIHLERRQLTLMLNGAYAGRFAIGVGHDHPPHEGQYMVINKMVNPPYNGIDRNIPGGDPNNPLGDRWMGLGAGPSSEEGYGIHGTNSTDPSALARPDLAGCIAMGPHDADDLFDILSIGSRITIRR
jgi:LysM repeat protein